jgi:hypothetical protein
VRRHLGWRKFNANTVAGREANRGWAKLWFPWWDGAPDFFGSLKATFKNRAYAVPAVQLRSAIAHPAWPIAGSCGTTSFTSLEENG